MPDRLTELFASKPTSYLGAGIIYNGDTRGNGVSSSELDAQVIPRFNGGGDAGSFTGQWAPRRGSSLTELIVGAGTIFDGTTIHSIAEATVTVSASALQYVYLVCTLSPTLIDGYVAGGTITATPSIAAYSSVQTNTNTTGYILLCTWQAGAVVQRYVWFGFVAELLNKNTGDTVFNYGPT